MRLVHIFLVIPVMQGLSLVASGPAWQASRHQFIGILPCNNYCLTKYSNSVGKFRPLLSNSNTIEYIYVNLFQFFTIIKHQSVKSFINFKLKINLDILPINLMNLSNVLITSIEG